MRRRTLVLAPAYSTILVIGAVATDTWRSPIHAAVRERFGLAPRDLSSLELWRILTSLVLTHGGAIFWGSLVIGFFCIAWAERRFGPFATALVFLTAHTGSFLATTLLVTWPLVSAGSSLGADLGLTHDVGGSAGYYGCLGLAVAGWDSVTWRRRLHVAMVLLFVARLVGSIWIEAHHTTLSGDIAHPIAYGIGASVARLAVARFPTRSPGTS